MTPQTVTPENCTSAPDEEHILDVLRHMRPAALQALLDELLRLSADPRCAESQADGVPCATAHGDCESCARFADFLQGVRARVAEERPR